jgi:membrane protein
MSGGLGFIKICKKTYQHWWAIEPAREAAVVSFYALSSLVPLSLILAVLFTLIFGDSTILNTVIDRVALSIGQTHSTFLKDTVTGPSFNGALTGIIVGAIVLVLSSIGMFDALKYSIDKIWQTQKSTEKHPFFRTLSTTIKQKLILFSVIPFVALVFAGSFILTLLMHTLETAGGALFPFTFPLIQVLDPIVSFIVSVALFFLLYKILPERKLPFTETLLGALLTAVLFLFGEFLIGYYLKYGAGVSVFGAAGSLVALLLFVYYASHIFFIGASFTYIYAQEHGSLSSKDHS